MRSAALKFMHLSAGSWMNRTTTITPSSQFESLDIELASFPDDLLAVQAIFREYVQSTQADLGFQNYETEFANLPGAYAQPQACVMLVRRNHNVAGCAALRKIDSATCELKRVYLSPNARGNRIGKRLVLAMIQQARAIGYQRMCLDVLPEFQSAQRLYENLGFSDAPPVSFNPVPGTRFMAITL
jgi:ribosomal protein S18 acetylase RimI-like enzyme